MWQSFFCEQYFWPSVHCSVQVPECRKHNVFSVTPSRCRPPLHTGKKHKLCDTVESLHTSMSMIPMDVTKPYLGCSLGTSRVAGASDGFCEQVKSRRSFCITDRFYQISCKFWARRADGCFARYPGCPGHQGLPWTPPLQAQSQVKSFGCSEQHLTNQGGILFERTRKGGGGKREDDKDKKAARLVFFFPLRDNFFPPSSSSSFFNFQVQSNCSDSEQQVRADWNQKKQRKWQH